MFNYELLSYLKLRNLCASNSGFVINDEIREDRSWLANEYFSALFVAQHKGVKYVRFYDYGDDNKEKDLHYISGGKFQKSSYEIKAANLQEAPSYQLWTEVDFVDQKQLIKKTTFRVFKLNPREKTNTFFSTYEFQLRKSKLLAALFENKSGFFQCANHNGIQDEFSTFFSK